MNFRKRDVPQLAECLPGTEGSTPALTTLGDGDTHMLSQDLMGTARNLRPAWMLFFSQEIGKKAGRQAGNIMTLTLRKKRLSEGTGKGCHRWGGECSLS